MRGAAAAKPPAGDGSSEGGGLHLGEGRELHRRRRGAAGAKAGCSSVGGEVQQRRRRGAAVCLATLPPLCTSCVWSSIDWPGMYSTSPSILG